MMTPRRLVVVALFLALVLGLGDSGQAQDPPETPIKPAIKESTERPVDAVLSDVKARLASLEKDPEIEDAVKEGVKKKYESAITALNAAARQAEEATKFRLEMGTAAEKTERLLSQMKGLPPSGAAVRLTFEGSTGDLQKEMDLKGASLANLRSDLMNAQNAWTRVRDRPLEITRLQPDAEKRLAALESQIAAVELSGNTESIDGAADRIFRAAEREKLVQELAMLEQEKASQSLLENLLTAERDLLERQVENAAAEYDSLKEEMNRRLADEAQKIIAEVVSAMEAISPDDKEVHKLAAEVTSLAKDFKAILAERKKVESDQKDTTTRFDRLKEEERTLREQLDLRREGGAMAQALLDLRLRLPGNGSLEAQSANLSKELDHARLGALHIESNIREQSSVEKKFADRLSMPVSRLLAARKDVLLKLRLQSGKLVRAISATDAEQGLYQTRVDVVRRFLDEQLFWLRSSPPISLKTVTDAPSGIHWLFSAKRWEELGRSISYGVDRAPVIAGAALVLLAALMLSRRKLIDLLERTRVKSRRISTDSFRFTIEALACTILLALPIPLLIGYFAWSLNGTPGASPWLRGVILGFRFAAIVSLGMIFVAQTCRRNGLGIGHFRWQEKTALRVRRAIYLSAWTYVPGALVTYASFLANPSLCFENFGRIVFMLVHLWMGFLLWRLLRPSESILKGFIQKQPRGLISRLKYFWPTAAIAASLTIVVLAGLGYLITTINLTFELFLTSMLIAGGMIVHGLLLRWFTVRWRKLALEIKLKERRARQEAKVSEEAKHEADEIVPLELDEQELHLDSLGAQTRSMLRFLVGLSVIMSMLFLWSTTIPIFAALDQVHPFGGLSILELGQAVLIVGVTWKASRNLRGFLELAALRNTSMEPGTRVAIATLCQYAVIAIGTGMLLGVLNVDWAKFGWIAAALSVGLGFGLQEVVANFVSGLILLFERPIRRGDVVTIEGITGTVSKISLRATTITNWDRQDFIVPNKQFITGTVLNWTLTTPLNRILLTVGIAYGNDAKEARRILLDVAQSNPTVLTDPAPVASFEEFADSSLTLRLRAYLPDLDSRIRTISELHDEIARRFAEAGIEIAFPQRDIYLRGGWENLSDQGSGKIGKSGAGSGATTTAN